MAMIEGAGVPLHVTQAGPADGPTAVLVHGMAADAATLTPLAEALAEAGLRVIAYDRRGYGASGAPEPYLATTVEEQAEDLRDVILTTVADPALLVGTGFGALVALDIVRRYRTLARAVVAHDPPCFAFVPEATEGMAAQRLMLEEALRAGGPPAAVAAWLGDDAPADEVARAQAARLGFFADYAGLASWPATRSDLRAMDLPAVVLTGPASPHDVVLAADRMVELMPGARRDGGGDLVAAALTLA